MTIRLTLLALLAAALAAAPASASASGPVPLLTSENTQSIAVAGPDVIVSRNGPLGTVRVDAYPAAGGPARTLLRTAPRGEDTNAYTQVAASPQRVALVTLLVSARGEFTEQLYSGPPTGPLTLVESVHESSGWGPDAVVVDGDRMLVLEQKRDANRLRLFAPGAAPRVVPLAKPLTGAFAFAGQRLAFETDENIVLADLATGSRLRFVRTDLSFNLDVAADGGIVADGDDIGVFTVMPSGLRQGVPDGEFLENPRFAGDAIAAIEETPAETDRPVVLAPGAIHPRAVGLPSSIIEVMDADAAGMAWIANGCVLYAAVDAVAPAEPPPGPCARAEATVETASSALRGRTIRLIGHCIAATATGCDGTVTVHEPGIVGRGAFHAAAGKQERFTVRFRRRSARRLRRDVRKNEDTLLDVTIRLTGGGPPDHDNDLLFIDKVRPPR